MMTQLVTPQCMIENKNTVFSLLRSSDQKKWQTGSCCATRRKYLRGLEAPSEWRSPRHSFPIKAKKGFSSLQLDLMDKIFTRSPKNGLSQTLQLFTPAPGRRVTWFQMFSPSLLWSHQSYQLKERPPSHIETVSIYTKKNPYTRTARRCRRV